MNPPWWIVFPPPADVMRGLFWAGYRDASRWFDKAPDRRDFCGCRAPGGRPGRRSGSPAESPRGGPRDDDALKFTRVAKHTAARRLLLQKPQRPKDALPELDPVTGQNVEELIRCYKRCAEKDWRILNYVFWACMAALTAGVLAQGRGS